MYHVLSHHSQLQYNKIIYFLWESVFQIQQKIKAKAWDTFCSLFYCFLHGALFRHFLLVLELRFVITIRIWTQSWIQTLFSGKTSMVPGEGWGDTVEFRHFSTGLMSAVPESTLLSSGRGGAIEIACFCQLKTQIFKFFGCPPRLPPEINTGRIFHCSREGGGDVPHLLNSTLSEFDSQLPVNDITSCSPKGIVHIPSQYRVNGSNNWI